MGKGRGEREGGEGEGERRGERRGVALYGDQEYQQKINSSSAAIS